MGNRAQHATAVSHCAAGGNQRVEIRRLADIIGVILAILVAGVFITVLLGTVDFPLGTHADEASKVDSILNGQNPSYHPILMLQIVRAANAVAGLSDPQAVVKLGHQCAVIAGGFAVIAAFLLARTALPNSTALAATIAFAVVPLLTVHARYLKEDIFTLPFLLLALAILIDTLKSPTSMRGVLLGAMIGLAAAAKYISAIMLPFALILLMVFSPGSIKSRASVAGLVAVVAIGLFGLIEIPAFLNFAQFESGVEFELRHAREGHDVRLPITLTYGLFHLRKSLLPGLGLPLLILGGLGLAAPWFAATKRRAPLFIIAAFALLWFSIHELSPLKPYPGFARYMLPLAPLLIILGAAFVGGVVQRLRLDTGMVEVVILAAALPALYLSLLINGPTQEDLRSVIPAIVIASEPRTAFDSYTRFSGVGGVGRQASIKSPASAATDDLLVTSNFTYGRYDQFGTAREQPKGTRAVADYYAKLFELPYLEVESNRPSYGFFNPVIRIIELDGRSDRLAPIAAALRRNHPMLKVSSYNE
jgi:4-amino-4-deoxy-L-arabinose transferase-like glycosyltransferase